MIKRKRDESASTWKEKGITSLPTEMKLKYSATCVLPFFTCIKTQILSAKDPRIVPQPIMLTAALGNTFLPSPLIRKPINGSNGIKYTICKTLLIYPSLPSPEGEV
jgi:hypothetical protein